MLDLVVRQPVAAQLRRRSGTRPPVASWMLVENAPPVAGDAVSDRRGEVDVILSAWEACDAESRALRQNLSAGILPERRRDALARRLAERERDGRFLLQRLAEVHAGV